MSDRDEAPRRCYLDKMLPVERAIYDAAQLVEEMPPDTRLTAAINHLTDARNLVADFIDGKA